MKVQGGVCVVRGGGGTPRCLVGGDLNFNNCWMQGDALA